jgi:hypothetical protein
VAVCLKINSPGLQPLQDFWSKTATPDLPWVGWPFATQAAYFGRRFSVGCYTGRTFRLPPGRARASIAACPTPAKRSRSAKCAPPAFRGLLIYCSDYQCSHWTAISGDPWPDEVRLIEGFSHFVTSVTAPIASGWSGCRVGLAPTGKRPFHGAHPTETLHLAPARGVRLFNLKYLRCRYGNAAGKNSCN